METTTLQNPIQLEATGPGTQQKKKPRRWWSQKRIIPKTEGDSVKKNTNSSHIENSAAVSVEDSLKAVAKPNNNRRRKRYFKNQTPVESSTGENNSQPNSEVNKTLQKPVESLVRNTMPNTKPTDKTKQEDGGKARENVLAERQARRLSKQKVQDKSRHLENSSPAKSIQKPSTKANVVPPVTKLAEQSAAVKINDENKSDKSREQILAERELKKQAKLSSKNKSKEIVTPAAPPMPALVKNVEDLTISEKPVLSKAERREKQEAQRAAKAKLIAEKTKGPAVQSKEKKIIVEKEAEKSPPTKKNNSISTTQHKVKLFNHLYADKIQERVLNSNIIHPAIVKLGAQYANGNIVGSNARCIAFMARIKKVIEDYVTPLQKEFGRGLEEILQPSIQYLHQCRPLPVSITNALKFIKWQISQLPGNQSDADLKEHLRESVDTYVRDQIEKAAQAISITVQEKISNGDVILTFGCSSLISHIIEEAQKRKVDFRVIVVDARPHHEGQEMLRRLVENKIRCTCVLINAIGFVMPEVTKVLLGANALLANGYVMSRAGTAQIALMAKSYNVPVLVCCETHKFSERVQTDAFVFNEIGDPQDLVLKTTKNASNEMQNWKTIPQLTPLNLRYDITPPELVTAVVTELAILPCTSVPVILRIKPSEGGY